MLQKVLQALAQLFVYNEFGQLSHTKVWSSVAYGICSWVVIYQTLHGRLTTEVLLWYLVIAGGHSAIAKYINARQSGSYQFPDYRRRYQDDDSVETHRTGGAKAVE